ncbi:MAG: hypothetical protein JSU01_15035 [Bacteroidetes bacterium]|nr:hypothetical protein [Bacteroidota bacterium]
MKRLLFILIPIAFGSSACVHDDSQTASVASSGGSFNPKLPADSSSNLANGTAAGPTGLTKKTDTIPQPLTIPNPGDTSQKKNLNPPR